MKSSPKTATISNKKESEKKTIYRIQLQPKASVFLLFIQTLLTPRDDAVFVVSTRFQFLHLQHNQVLLS